MISLENIKHILIKALNTNGILLTPASIISSIYAWVTSFGFNSKLISHPSLKAHILKFFRIFLIIFAETSDGVPPPKYTELNFLFCIY